MQKWEYMVLYLELDPYKTPDLLQEAGKEGWEAVGMSPHGTFMAVLFKRRIS
jgi:hypothetical protein